MNELESLEKELNLLFQKEYKKVRVETIYQLPKSVISMLETFEVHLFEASDSFQIIVDRNKNIGLIKTNDRYIQEIYIIPEQNSGELKLKQVHEYFTCEKEVNKRLYQWFDENNIFKKAAVIHKEMERIKKKNELINQQIKEVQINDNNEITVTINGKRYTLKEKVQEE
jgi:hypothetical protein